MRDLQKEIAKIKILVCCHKKCELPSDSNGIFLPIHVGAALSGAKLDMQRDDQANGEKCDNISEKNKNYCELTAMYWAWKNMKKIHPDIEYIGLNHYRRYFDFKRNTLFSDENFLNEKDISKYSVNVKKLSRTLEKHDAISAKPRKYPFSIKIHYALCHFSEDFKTLSRTVKKLFPEYAAAYDYVMEWGNSISCYNMFVMKWTDFEKYCQWLFPILFECEKQIPYKNYDELQRRIFGYMAERLLNVYFLHNFKKVKKLPIAFYAGEEILAENSLGLYRRFATYIRYSLAHYFQNSFLTNLRHCIRK